MVLLVTMSDFGHCFQALQGEISTNPSIFLEQHLNTIGHLRIDLSELALNYSESKIT